MVFFAANGTGTLWSKLPHSQKPEYSMTEKKGMCILLLYDYLCYDYYVGHLTLYITDSLIAIFIFILCNPRVCPTQQVPIPTCMHTMALGSSESARTHQSSILDTPSSWAPASDSPGSPDSPPA